jgi:hypothetical protein
MPTQSGRQCEKRLRVREISFLMSYTKTTTRPQQCHGSRNPAGPAPAVEPLGPITTALDLAASVKDRLDHAAGWINFHGGQRQISSLWGRR